MKSPTEPFSSPRLGGVPTEYLITVPKPRRTSDATLVRRSQQGDRRAFSALLGRYDWRLRGLAHALLLDRAEMDVALATGYLRAWRDVVRVDPKDDVAAWLYRVTYNACIDQLRRAEDAAGSGEAAPAGRSGIAAGLATLPAAERVAVVLVDREGFSPASAARILGMGESALSATLDSARERLIPHIPEPAPAAEPAGEAPSSVDAAETSEKSDPSEAPDAADAAATPSSGAAELTPGAGSHQDGPSDTAASLATTNGDGKAQSETDGDGRSSAAPLDDEDGVAPADPVERPGDEPVRAGVGSPVPAEAADAPEPKAPVEVEGSTGDAFAPNGSNGNAEGAKATDGTGEGVRGTGDGDGSSAKATGDGDGSSAKATDGTGEGARVTGDGDGSSAKATGDGDGSSAKATGVGDGDGSSAKATSVGNGDGSSAKATGDGDGSSVTATGDGNGNGSRATANGGNGKGGGNADRNRGRGRRARRRAEHSAGQPRADGPGALRDDPT